MLETQKLFKSFVLRFWQGADGGWRIRLDPLSRGAEGRYFSDLESLLVFLLESPQPHPKGRDPPKPSA